MAGCVDCRNEVAELAVLPGLLSRLDAATAVTTLSKPPAQAPPGVLAAALAAATAERRRYRRRHRWQVAVTGIAAASLAMLLGLGAVTVSGEPRQPAAPVMAQMTPVNPNDAIFAMVGYTAHGRGTTVTGVCLYENQSQYSKQWDVYLMVYGHNGQSERVAQWPVGGPNADDSAKSFTGEADMAPADIDHFALTKADGTPLLWLKAG
jgi:hypothetical protein